MSINKLGFQKNWLYLYLKVSSKQGYFPPGHFPTHES